MAVETIEHPDRLVIYPSRRKAILVLLGATAFVCLGLWIGSPGMSSRVSMIERVIATYIGVPFFGLCGLYAAYRIVVRRPAIVVDATGLTDTSHPFGVGYLSWDEIDRVVLYKYQGQGMLGIYPKNLDTLMSRLEGMRSKYMRANLALGCAPVNLAQVMLPMKLADLADLMRARYGVRAEADEALK